MGYLEKDALPVRSLCSGYSIQQRITGFSTFAPILKLLYFAPVNSAMRRMLCTICKKQCDKKLGELK